MPRRQQDLAALRAELPRPVAVPREEAERDAEDAAEKADAAIAKAISLPLVPAAGVADLCTAQTLARIESIPVTALRTLTELIERLKGKCPKYVMTAVGTACNCLRDVVMFRVRCLIPPGDREAFITMCRAVFLENLNEQLTEREESRLLQAYQRRMHDKPDAFLSIHQRIRRREPRGRAAERRLQEAAAAAEEPMNIDITPEDMRCGRLEPMRIAALASHQPPQPQQPPPQPQLQPPQPQLQPQRPQMGGSASSTDPWPAGQEENGSDEENPWIEFATRQQQQMIGEATGSATGSAPPSQADQGIGFLF